MYINFFAISFLINTSCRNISSYSGVVSSYNNNSLEEARKTLLTPEYQAPLKDLLLQRRHLRSNICCANRDPETRQLVDMLARVVPPELLKLVEFPKCLCGRRIVKSTDDEGGYCAYDHERKRKKSSSLSPASARKKSKRSPSEGCADSCDGWQCEEWRRFLNHQNTPLLLKDHTSLYVWLTLLHFGLPWETEQERQHCTARLLHAKKHLQSVECFVKERPILAAFVVILLCWETGKFF